MPIELEVSSVSTDLKRKTANIRLKERGRITASISIGPFPFDPPGQQTEDELEALALEAAKDILKSGIIALGG